MVASVSMETSALTRLVVTCATVPREDSSWLKTRLSVLVSHKGILRQLAAQLLGFFGSHLRILNISVTQKVSRVKLSACVYILY